jgi:NTP pyrophosphatase (non-canonical NTP hydrolase)
MMTLEEIEIDHANWEKEKFPKCHYVGSPLVGINGMIEEVGELTHCVLKASQGIRGTLEEHKKSAEDAIGDIGIYFMSTCNAFGVKLSDIVADYDNWTDIDTLDFDIFTQIQKERDLSEEEWSDKYKNSRFELALAWHLKYIQIFHSSIKNLIDAALNFDLEDSKPIIYKLFYEFYPVLDRLSNIVTRKPMKTWIVNVWCEVVFKRNWKTTA